MSLVRALLRHPSGRIGGCIILLFLLAALLGQLGLTPHDPLQQMRLDRLKPPSLTHVMGTDLFGRDVASRVMLAIGQSFIVGFLAVGIAATLGTVLGLTAAWFGRLWDGVVMRSMDVLLAFPAILLALLIIAVAGPGTWTSVTAIAIVYTPIFTRVVRGPALSIKTRGRGLAAAAFADHRQRLAGHQVEIDAVDGVDRAGGGL